MEDGHLIPDDEVWYVADAIPNGSVAAILLLEHLWAIPLRDAISVPAASRSPTSGSTPATWSQSVPLRQQTRTSHNSGGCRR